MNGSSASHGLNGFNGGARSKVIYRAHPSNPFNPWLKNFWLFCAFLSLFLCSCSSQRDPSTVQMAVGGQTQFIYLPLTLASQLGFFKDEGLTVNISDLRGGSEAVAALISGSVDAVTGFYEHTVRARAQGKQLVMVALFDRYPGVVLMVSNRHLDAVKTIQDLVGKPVGVTAVGSSTDQLLKYLLRKNGLDPQAIPVVTAGVSPMLAALQQDQIWAGVIVDPLALKLEHDGIAKALYDTRTEQGTVEIFGGPWPAGGFYISEEFVRRHPMTVQKLVNAGLRALRYIKDHSPEEIAAAMPPSFWAGDRDQYVSSLRANMGLYSSDGVLPEDGAANVLKSLSMVDGNIVPAKIDLKQTYDNSFVGRAQQ